MRTHVPTERRQPTEPALAREPGAADARPVLLATMGVPIALEAERVAIEAALETGTRLVIVNVVWLPPFPTTVMLVGPAGATLPHEDGVESVRETARRAAAQSVPTLLLRVSTPRPVRALLEVVEDERPGLVVLGPEPGLMRARTLRVAARRIAAETPFLLWSILPT